MAYDLELAERVRQLVCFEPGTSVQAMFGGLAFLVNGHLAVAVSGQGGLMLRVPPEHTDEVTVLPHAGPMEMSGRVARGWVRVDASGCEDDAELADWVGRGLDHARSLPPKD